MRTTSSLLLLVALLAPTAAAALPQPFTQTIVNGSYNGAFGVEHGDLDGDGDIDFVATAWYGDTVDAFLNDGTGSFTQTTIASVDQPGELELADVDQDGDLDVVVGTIDDVLSWFANDGVAGTWTPNVIATDPDPFEVGVADLDGDGDLDVVSARYNTNNDIIYWYENLDGVGGSWSAGNVISNSDDSWDLELVDLDQDGDVDVLNVDENSGDVRWWLNDGTATDWSNTDFIDFTAAQAPQVAEAVDMDRDGDLDLAISFYGADKFSWFANDGSLGTWTETTMATGDACNGFVLDDVDHDGDIDLVGAIMGPADIVFVENLDGFGGSWSSYVVDANLGNAINTTAFDGDGDGDIDVLGMGFNADDVRYYTNDGNHGRTWSWDESVAIGDSNPRHTAVVDIDRDGDLDFVGGGTSGVVLGVNDGLGTFTKIDITTTNSHWAVGSGDFDGDGDVDVVSINNDSQSVSWYANDGSLGPWAPTTFYSTGGTTYGRDIATGDFDRDGDVDIATADSGRNDLIVHLNDGAGASFTQVVLDASYSGAYSLEAIDFDRDGDLDLVSAGQTEDEVTWWANDGTASVWTRTAVGALDDPFSADAVDADQDGDVDVIAISGDGAVVLFTNSGDDVTFVATVIDASLPTGRQVVAGDFDKDGDVDISTSHNDSVEVYLQEGGAFLAAIQVATGSNIAHGEPGDFDGDGDLDLVYPNISSGDDWKVYANDWAHASTDVADVGPAALQLPGTVDLLIQQITVSPGFLSTETAQLVPTLDLLFEDLAGVAFEQADLETILSAVSVYEDDGDGTFDPALDSLVGSTSTFALTNGALGFAPGNASLAWDQDTVLWLTVDVASDGGLMAGFDVQISLTLDAGVQDGSGNALASTGTTDASTLLNLDEAPTAAPGGSYTTDEGVAVTLDGSGSTDAEGAIVAYAWDCEDDGVTDGASATVSCTYPDDGSYTARLSVTDSVGTTSEATTTVTVANLDPTVTSISTSASVTEGGTVSLGATASDVAADTLTFTWQLTDPDGVPSTVGTGANVTAAVTGDGTWIATVTVSDDDGGSASQSQNVVVSNAAPTVLAFGDLNVVEGATGSYVALPSDPGGDAVSVSWVLEDASGAQVATDTGMAATFVFPDDGTYAAIATADDGDGGTATSAVTVTVTNAAPTISVAGDASADEGGAVSYSATTSDVAADPVSVSWALEDAGGAQVDTATGATATFTVPDDGTYTVTATADDGDGGTATDAVSVTVANVAPAITSTATGAATEGVQWTYAPTVTEPGADTLAFTTSGAPAALSVDGSTGALAWTPDYADVGSVSFTLSVEDGDGGADSETISLVVAFSDLDGDGMPDTWETANGLDPSVDDSAADPDADGLTNLDEYGMDLDPLLYDGPDAPVVVSPVGDAEVATGTPTLTWDNAEDPNEDPITYEVQVWEDSSLTVLLDGATGLTEDASGSTSWTPSVAVAENGTGYWRVRAADAWVDGPWTNLEGFFVNAVEEAPGTPVASSPLSGDTVGVVAPSLSWLEPTDPDGDALTYDVHILDGAGATVAEELDVAGPSWTSTVDLAEDTEYSWEVRAVDDTGLESGWSAPETFFVDTTNAAPSAVEWVSPLDDDAIEAVSPMLEVTESTDPEGDALTYVYELDTVATMDSADRVTGTSGTTWDLGAASVVLGENRAWFARVRVEDDRGAASEWTDVTFFVRGPNDAPAAPALVAPLDGMVFGPEEATPALVAGHAVDPEGDAVTYGFVLARDEALTDVVESIDGVEASAGPQGTADQTSWLPTTELEPGTYWWAASADDGDASADSDAWSFVVEEPATGDDDDDDSVGDDDDDTDPEAGCGCASVGRFDGGSAWMLLGVVAVVGVRRRR